MEVSKLAEQGCFDYLVIESTGISEPMQVSTAFQAIRLSPAVTISRPSWTKSKLKPTGASNPSFMHCKDLHSNTPCHCMAILQCMP